jgi:DNA helicase-2/ATP-dependent DNA helicase PcrA
VSETLDLNPAQRAAVEHAGGPLLVIAGAGSGKTRVLTARIERLLADGLPPDAVLAFTFTNRAAREMRGRLERSLGPEVARLWVGTFHATAVRILRREAAAAGIPRDFAIYDREDQETLLRGILGRLEVPEGTFRPGLLLNRISDAKSALVGPEDMARVAVSPWERRVAEIFALYQQELRRNGALDFDDLIAESVRLLQDHPGVGERWARRFAHVLVDEYQDTNHAQFRMVRALAAGTGNLFVVGDDDQSIYGWRGADLSNVLDFESAFPGAQVIRLEQNYRSTGNILRAANAVIAHNQARKGKTLWSEREDGPRLRFALAADEAGEARRVRGFLDAHVRRGGRYEDVAVLYRTNAQSRAFETELRHRGIPYEIVGGVAFYQRREVKDVLAYLRLLANPADAVSFFRIWNTPRRGLGPAVRVLLEERASREGIPPLEGLRALVREDALRGPARVGGRELLALLDELAAMAAGPLEALIRRLLEGSRYLEHLVEGDEMQDRERRANVEELAA